MRKEKSYSFPAILAAAAILLAYLCRITTKFGFELRLQEELILPLTLLRSILTAKGRSYSDPIYGEDGKIDMDASRRVEFKFRLKDSEMIDEMRDILKEYEAAEGGTQ